MKRTDYISWDEYFMGIAMLAARRSKDPNTQVGACIVSQDNIIISTGYNGAPRGRQNCSDLNFCMREKLQIPRGERYEMCRSVHAEANAIIAAPRDRMLGSTLYMVCVNPKDGSLYDGTNSCMMCKRQIINAGIETVIVRDTKDEYRIINVGDWIENDDSLSGQFGY